MNEMSFRELFNQEKVHWIVFLCSALIVVIIGTILRTYGINLFLGITFIVSTIIGFWQGIYLYRKTPGKKSQASNQNKSL